MNEQSNNAAILRNTLTSVQLIPTRLQGCTQFIPIARTLSSMNVCVANCVRDSRAFGNDDPNLEQDCRQCCTQCIEKNQGKTGTCDNGCAIGGQGGGDGYDDRITELQRQIYYSPPAISRSVTCELLRNGQEWEVKTYYIFPPNDITRNTVSDIVRTLYSQFYHAFVEARTVFLGINHRNDGQSVGQGVLTPILTMERRGNIIDTTYRQCQANGVNTATIAISGLPRDTNPPISSLVLYHRAVFGIAVNGIVAHGVAAPIVASVIDTIAKPQSTENAVECMSGSSAGRFNIQVTI